MTGPRTSASGARIVLAVATAALCGTSGAAAQQSSQQSPLVRVDSVAVEGNARVETASILTRAGIQGGTEITFREIQRATKELWSSGQFSDIDVRAVETPGPTGPFVTLVFQVSEAPLLRRVVINGLEHADEDLVRDSSGLTANSPFRPQSLVEARELIVSELAGEGIPFASVEDRTEPVEGFDNVVDLILDVTEGNRVSVADVVVRGNDRVSRSAILGAMSTKPEGFWWFRSGAFDPEDYAADLEQRLPRLYRSRGHLDFEVLSDTLVIDPSTGKARIELDVSEGRRYRVAELFIEGNQFFTEERLRSFFETESGGLLASLGIGGRTDTELIGQPFDQSAFEAAVAEIEQLYRNQGYIFAQVRPVIESSSSEDEESPEVRIGVAIAEGSPAIIRRIAIAGNEYTHDWVIRDKIFMLPGDVYSQDRVLRSYQSISSLGFFEAPLPFPDIDASPETGDVDVTFNVVERQTGSVNFGTTVGGGTGLAGFIGYDQPNLFGQGKETHFRWDFGEFLSSLTLSYTDPALFRSRVSGSVSLFNATDRFISFQNGRRRRIGTSVRFGFPVPGDPRTRLFAGYAITRTKLELREGVSDRSIFGQPDGILSQLQLGIARSTLDHPLFPTTGSRLAYDAELNGGVLGGDGDFSKHTVEGTWWIPVGRVGEGGGGSALRFALGLSLKAGAIFGDASRFPFDQFWMGGVQFGQTLRGYDETSITPFGFFPENSTGIDDINRIGRAFMTVNAEYAMRLNSNLSISTFFDAGNIWGSAAEIEPTQLFRGAGFGVQLVTPFGPIGLDYAYGFDKPVPGWQFHFRMGPGF